jgi:hypothetical protein
MKKLVFSSLLALGALTSQAQLPAGTVAPNFTGTDLNGTTHSLYDYLDDCYTVIVDVSATWCPPCWSYHQAHVLRDIYVNHGPAGMPGVSANTTNSVMVIFIEGDGQTTNADLNGTGSNTQGDWVTGTPYPIIDNASIANTLGIGYFPTIYTIYPDRYLEESGALTLNGHIANINSKITQHNCGGAGVDPSLFAYTGETSTCSQLQAKVRVQNKGDQPLPSGTTVEALEGTTVVGTGSTTQTLNQYQTQEVTIPVTISQNTSLTFRVVGTGDINVANNEVTQAVTLAKESGTPVVTIEITTDRYGSETTWNLRNQANQIVAQGGPYTNASSNGAYPKPSVTVSLANNNCYKLTVNDSFGDGMCCSYGDGFIRIVDGWGVELAKADEFTEVMTGNMKSGSYASVEEVNTIDVEVYPNPVSTTAIISFENLTAAETSIEVTNLVGQVVINEFLGNVVGAQYIEINASDLNSGLYLVNIKSGNTVTTKRIVVAK